MPTRDSAPVGAPCWTDLWTSDVAGSRRFYSELFGWEALEPSEEFGGYFMFARNGVPIAGGMGAMGDVKADNSWRIYLATDNTDKTIEQAESAGGTVIVPAMAVADLGTQSMAIDPTGAVVGTWQPDSFPGFTVLGEPGTPCWFELHTRDHTGALDFYRAVFNWDITMESDTDEFRYATATAPSGGDNIAGIMDSSGFLPEGQPPFWAVYWYSDDVDATVAKVKALGGSVLFEPEDTPYGRLATVADPTGAEFRLHHPNR